jgi:hypothetical protein
LFISLTARTVYLPDGTSEDRGTDDVHDEYRDVPFGFLFGVSYDRKLAGRLRLLAELRAEYNKGFFGNEHYFTSRFVTSGLMVGVGF